MRNGNGCCGLFNGSKIEAKEKDEARSYPYKEPWEALKFPFSFFLVILERTDEKKGEILMKKKQDYARFMR